MKSVKPRIAIIETLESLTLMSASVIEGTDAGEWINGDSGDHLILGKGGNDEIYAPLGSNVIDGGSGNDAVLVYGGVRADYSVSSLSDGSYVLQGADLNGNDTVSVLRSVERIIFDDVVVSLDSLDPAPAPEIPAQEFLERPVEMMATPVRQPAAAPIPAPEPAPAPEPTVAPPQFAAVAAAPVVDSDFLSRVVDLTNDIRRQYGLSELSVNSQLQQAAQTHSSNMAAQDFFSHYGIDGSMPWDRGQDAGYDYSLYGENIAAGQTTPEAVVQAWVNSPTHLENILNPGYTEIGVGYEYLQNDTGNVNFNHYWAQEFGTQRSL